MCKSADLGSAFGGTLVACCLGFIKCVADLFLLSCHLLDQLLLVVGFLFIQLLILINLYLNAEQKHVETNLQANVSGVSLFFSFIDEDQDNLFSQINACSSAHYLRANLKDMHFILQVYARSPPILLFMSKHMFVFFNFLIHKFPFN